MRHTSASPLRSPRRGVLVGALSAALVAVGAAGGALFFLLRGEEPSTRVSKAPIATTKATAPASQVNAGGPPGPLGAVQTMLDQTRQGLDQLGQLRFGSPPSTGGTTARSAVVDWTKRRVPDLDAEAVAKRIEEAGFRIVKSGVDRTPPFDRFQYTVEGSQCTGGALYFRFPTVAEANQLEQGMAAAPSFRVVRDDRRVVQVMLGSLPTMAPSAACTDRVAEALTE